MKHHIRTTICQAAFGVAAVMAISAVPAVSAYADNSGVFQPDDEQFGAGWQVLQAPARPAPAAAPAPAPAPIVDEPPVYTTMAAPGSVVVTPNAAQLARPSGVAAPASGTVVAMLSAPSPAPASIAAALAPTPIPAADKVLVANSLSSGETLMSAAMPAAPPAAHTFDLQAGLSLEQQLQAWSHDAGWTLTWNLPDDWVVPGNSSYGTDFAQATQQVIEQAANNGADIRADLYPGNHSLVVHQAGALR